jgi:hypothetical protein
MKKRLGAVLAVLAGLMTAFGSSPAAAVDGWTVVAKDLDNPRGLAFGTFDGSDALYVAEAGRGGAGPCGVALGGETVCYGPTGAITKITGVGKQRRVASGLPSLAGPLGFGAAGPHDVAVWDGRAYVPIGFGGSSADRAAFSPVGPLLGTLARVLLASGMWRPVADLVDYEGTFNPDGMDLIANPDASLALPGHRYVLDAGGNTLFDLRNEGRVGFEPTLQLLSVFPVRLVPAPPFLMLPPGTMIPMQSVPTSMVLGPDGALYVGEFTAFPFPVGGARVYRLERHLFSFGAPTVYASGLTTIIDLDFDEDGNLYVLEHRKNGLLSSDTTGALIRVSTSGAQTEIASTGLVNPAGLAIGDHTAYVSNFGTSPAVGEVVAIPLD